MEEADGQPKQIIGTFDVMSGDIKVAKQDFNTKYGEVKIALSKDIIDTANKLDEMIRQEIESFFNVKENTSE